MADQDIQLRMTQQGDPEFAEVVMFAEAIRAALAPLIMDDPNRVAKAMTAACMFAGTMFGTLIVMGLATDQDTKRTADSMRANFRSGIDVGKKRALRLEAEMFGGTKQ
jgi:hypothetical protein